MSKINTQLKRIDDQMCSIYLASKASYQMAFKRSPLRYGATDNVLSDQLGKQRNMVYHSYATV